MAINSLSTGFRPGVCTSSTRPTAPYEGQQIYETDTDKTLVWNGSAWLYLSTPQTTEIGGAWVSYTPTITQGATLTKTIDYAKYTQINKLVVCHIMCSITSAGTAANILAASLPITPANVDQPYFGCNGSATFYDASAATPYVLGVHIGASSIANFVGIAAGGDYFGVTPGITAASGDQFSFIISYEAA